MRFPPYVREADLRSFVESALNEDVGSGDHSSNGALPEGLNVVARLHIKAPGILAGIDVARFIFQHKDPELHFQPLKADGDAVAFGDIGFEVRGSARSILTAERLVLNCMQRMSGIATKTSELVKLIQGHKAKLLDTRKTTPNFRMLEKWAVKIGGGQNHRFGLYDMVMLKDNHIDFAGGIANALRNTKMYLEKMNLSIPIEVETRNLDEVQEVLDLGGVDTIMLDNMAPADMQKAVDLIGPRAKVEASGGITESTIGQIAACGVDYISVGALTHSFQSLDMSLKAEKLK